VHTKSINIAQHKANVKSRLQKKVKFSNHASVEMGIYQRTTHVFCEM